MKKLLLATAIGLAVISLTGCGEDSDGIFGSVSSNELEINSFERVNNNIARIETEYSDGERDIDVTNIRGSFDLSSINNLSVSTVLANNFEGTLEDRYIEVNNRTVTRPIYAKNNNRKINLETTYRTIDLSGTKANSYNASSNINNRSGILTDLNNYPRISDNNPNIAFPNGSVCYIPVTTSELRIFTFNTKKLTSYQTLDDWIQATENRFGNNRKPIRTSSDVGTNNEYDLEQIKFRATNSEPEYLYNGINYDNKIYETDYIKSGTNNPNENSSRGVVDCTLVNDVAADFLEDQIRINYR